ncbi:MAG: translation initiation factor [Verrucomicrobia bacterium]|nr:MAG: translation initiation factor [Verrucomicrobiota bacterium]
MPFSELQIEGAFLEEKLTSLEEPLAKISGRLILTKERAHRAGKTVLIVRGFSAEISAEVINSLAKEAKIACGCGGTVINRNIELQGNQPQRVRKFFESKGFRVDGI